MLSEKVKHVERSGVDCKQTGQKRPCLGRLDAREEGRTQLWDKKQQAFLLLEIYIARLSSKQVLTIYALPKHAKLPILRNTWLQ